SGTLLTALCRCYGPSSIAQARRGIGSDFPVEFPVGVLGSGILAWVRDDHARSRMPALQRAGREIIIRKQEIVNGVFHTLFMELQQRISVGTDPVSMGTGQPLPLLGRQDGILMLVWKKHLSILRLMLATTTGRSTGFLYQSNDRRRRQPM